MASGRSQTLVVTGEPGVGKTALARQLMLEATDRGFQTAWSWCWTASEAPPFWPWRLVTQELGWSDVDWTETASAFDSLSSYARGGGPTLIFFDDAQGADESSLKLVNLLVRALSSTPIGMVVTVCEEDVPQGTQIARLLDEVSRGGIRLDLVGLDKQGTSKLVRRVAGDAVPPLIQDAIASASDGNPFLIEQLARETTAGRELTRPDLSLGFNVPRGADAILDRVLTRISKEARHLLSEASVLGRVFSVDLLTEVSEANSEGISMALTEATEKGGVRRIDSLGTYEFTHALLRERLYEDLTDERRTSLHLSAARVLEKRSDPSLLGELAHHLFKAGTQQPDVRQAVEVILQAAREAETSGSPEGSARHLYRATRLARAAGLSEMARTIEQQRQVIQPEPTPVSEPQSGLTGTLKKEGEFWSVGLGGPPVLLKHSKGLTYLAQLISTPQKEWHCLDLASPTPRKERPMSTDTGPILDATAKAEFRQRLLDLEEDIAEATEFHDDGRLRKAEAEKQFLLDELAAATGLGGRDRVVSSDSERARVAVTRAIRSALRRISAAHRPLGDHLDRTIQTGTFLSYRPDPIATPAWEL